ncbi:hypothetical protein [Zoogloea sp.]|uniref:hypothetical protein n=1 Tax=Zoogloea sp. TaxID=49181 RepID=UPI002FE0DB21
MDFELRLATLSKLLDNPSEVVQERLREEFRRTEKVLLESSDYDELERALRILTVLAPKFHGAIVPTLVSFVRSVGARPLTQGGEPLNMDGQRHQSPSHLILEAIEVPNAIRYAHIEAMVGFLLELSRSADREIREKSQSALVRLASFNLHFFSTLGASPQSAIVARLSSLQDDELVTNTGAVLRVLTTVLSAAMEGETWTYNTITFARGSVPSDGGVAQMRVAAIELLKRLYLLEDAVAHRRAVFSALNAATRRESGAFDAESEKMYERDALAVLDFSRQLVATEKPWVLQTIEHDAYWNYVHATSRAIEQAALAVRDALTERTDYQIYKQLIGFEGIFGEWEKLRSREEEWDYSNTKRLEVAKRYVESIDEGNRAEWRDRILEFSKTESDDLATFPVYYEFLAYLAEQKPDLALELVRDHEARMRPFLIPLISGLRASEHGADLEEIVKRWIAEGTHLVAIAKSLFKGSAQRLDTLSAVVARAAELDDRDAISIAMGMAASLHGEGAQRAKAVFMQGLRAMAQFGDARWARVFWYMRDFKTLVSVMEVNERLEVLTSLSKLPALDYQAEELLQAIGEQDPDAVFGFLSDRLTTETKDREERRAEGRNILDDKFEAIPYQLQSLNKLLVQYPQALIDLLRHHFDSPEDRAMFPYRGGARLVKGAFPNFDAPLQAMLLKLVENGGDDDIEFVTAIVRTYGGGSSILDVCRAIVKVAPTHSRTWREVAAAIETTGVVSGEYGMVHAFERKRDELAVWKSDENEQIRAFAEWLTEQLERMITHERQRADENLALRKYKYGERNDEGRAPHE